MQLTLFDSLKQEIEVSGGIVPRDYQQAAHDRAFDLWAAGSAGAIVRQATGTGKTILAILIMAAWLKLGKDRRVIVLCHEIQLIDQFADEVEDVLGTRPGIEQGTKNHIPANKVPQITIASRDSLRVRTSTDEDGIKIVETRLHKFDVHRYKFLVIADECHRYLKKGLKSCKPIFEHFDGCPRLGLTATPERGDKRTLSDLFPDVAADYRLIDIDGGPSAVGDGWAVPYDQRFIVVEGVDFKDLNQSIKQGDFAPEAIEALLKEREILLGFVKPTVDLVEDRRTLVFCATVAMTKAVAHTINEFKPGQAIALDGGTRPEDRRDVYRRHQAGEFQFLVVCGLCREGYNDPGIGAVAVFRPTKSRGLAEQMKGRGCRPLRGCVTAAMSKEQRLEAIAASEKDSCMIIDLVGITGLADCASTAHILAEGKPDEVIERANKNALEKDGPIDMADEVRKAQVEIDEEREAARQERLERERREQEEAERRAKLKAEVRYTQRQVAQGGGSRVHQPGRRVCMPFGKFKGEAMTDIPDWYLQSVATKDWCKTKWIRKAAQRELDGRNGTQTGGDVPQGMSPDDVNQLLQTL